jgi:CheY-like chemotaxis protein
MIKILLVEDNELNSDMLSRRLQGQGYEVVIAVDGKQALEKVSEEKPDLILMDLSLPEMDGWEATRRLKADDTTRDIPIIVLTAHALKTDKLGAMEAGSDDYDVKPIDFPRLLSKIHVQLDKVSKAEQG